MFKNNLTIFKINTASSLLDVNAGAFTLGEGYVEFMFRTFNKSKAAGHRTTQKVDFYMDMDEFSYFCELLRTLKIEEPFKAKKSEIKRKVLSEAKARTANGEQITTQMCKAKIEEIYSKEFIRAYQKLGGSQEKSGNWISRKMTVEKGLKANYPLVLRGIQGKGEKKGGLIVPRYKDNEADAIINIPTTVETAVKLGIAGQRAINIFDIWTANGVLEEKVEKLRFSKNSSEGNNNFNNVNDEDDENEYL